MALLTDVRVKTWLHRDGDAVVCTIAVAFPGGAQLAVQSEGQLGASSGAVGGTTDLPTPAQAQEAINQTAKLHVDDQRRMLAVANLLLSQLQSAFDASKNARSTAERYKLALDAIKHWDPTGKFDWAKANEYARTQIEAMAKSVSYPTVITDRTPRKISSWPYPVTYVDEKGKKSTVKVGTAEMKTARAVLTHPGYMVGLGSWDVQKHNGKTYYGVAPMTVSEARFRPDWQAWHWYPANIEDDVDVANFYAHLRGDEKHVAQEMYNPTGWQKFKNAVADAAIPVLSAISNVLVPGSGAAFQAGANAAQRGNLTGVLASLANLLPAGTLLNAPGVKNAAQTVADVKKSALADVSSALKDAKTQAALASKGVPLASIKQAANGLASIKQAVDAKTLALAGKPVVAQLAKNVSAALAKKAQPTAAAPAAAAALAAADAYLYLQLVPAHGYQVARFTSEPQKQRVRVADVKRLKSGSFYYLTFADGVGRFREAK